MPTPTITGNVFTDIQGPFYAQALFDSPYDTSSFLAAAAGNVVVNQNNLVIATGPADATHPAWSEVDSPIALDAGIDYLLAVDLYSGVHLPCRKCDGERDARHV